MTRSTEGTTTMTETPTDWPSMILAILGAAAWPGVMIWAMWLIRRDVRRRRWIAQAQRTPQR